MPNLLYINMELLELQQIISTTKIALNEKEEDLERLQLALQRLTNNKDDFINMKQLCLDPEYTPKTFHGDHAQDLNYFNENELQRSFVAIPNLQISDVENQIRERITSFQGELADIERCITTLETRYSNLTDLKNEVIKKL